MSFFTPVRDTTRGLHAYVRGVQWLRAHPRYLALLIIPWAIGFVALVAAVSLFVEYGDQIMGWLLFARPEDGWWRISAYYVLKALLYVATVVVTLLGAMLIMNIAASPVYEAISAAVERDVTGQGPPHLGFFGSFRVMLVELKKVAWIYGLSILLLLIPGVNVLSTASAAFLIGWDFFDYPLARRGWSFRQRLRLARGEFWAILGFGLWLVIPFAQIVMLPMAVAGGTLLNLGALQRRNLLTQSGARELVDDSDE